MQLFPDLQLPLHFVNRRELATVVHYTANAVRENAQETGDYEKLFRSAVTLSGVAMLKNDYKNAIQHIEDACAVPTATLFFLQLLRERFDLLRLLNFKKKFVADVLKRVDDALQSKKQQKKWARVVVFHGYPIDDATQQSARFPADAAIAVQNRICEVLEKEWQIGERDLAICSAGTEGDVMFAENPEVEVWYHKTELGEPFGTVSAQARHNRWILNTARMEAENSEKEMRLQEETHLYGLVLCNSDHDRPEVEVTDPESSSFFISEIRASKRFKGHVLTINPCVEASKGQSPKG
jgi:hypothetical protein